MIRTNLLRRYLLLSVALIIILLGWVLPILLLPFVNVLPYLQTKAFDERLLWSVTISAVGVLCCHAGASLRNRRLAMSMITSWKDVVGTLGGIAMFIYFAAELSANTFGSLVKIFPGDPYFARFEVTATEFSGSKYKSVTLDLKAQKDGGIHYLTLSKRLFDYPKFQPGDILLLQGKQNFFGVYVESFEKK